MKWIYLTVSLIVTVFLVSAAIALKQSRDKKKGFLGTMAQILGSPVKAVKRLKNIAILAIFAGFVFIFYWVFGLVQSLESLKDGWSNFKFEMPSLDLNIGGGLSKESIISIADTVTLPIKERPVFKKAVYHEFKLINDQAFIKDPLGFNMGETFAIFSINDTVIGGYPANVLPFNLKEIAEKDINIDESTKTILISVKYMSNPVYIGHTMGIPDYDKGESMFRDNKAAQKKLRIKGDSIACHLNDSIVNAMTDEEKFFFGSQYCMEILKLIYLREMQKYPDYKWIFNIYTDDQSVYSNDGMEIESKAIRIK